MFDTREDLTSPYYTTTKKYNKMVEDSFMNFTSATNSDQELIFLPRKTGKFNDNWDDMTMLNEPYQVFSHVNPKATSFSNCGGGFSNLGGRMKACKEQGLTGKEKRACAKKLRAMGWKKGQPIPEGLAISPDETANVDASKIETPPPAEGMSTLMKVGIGLGIAGVVGLIIYGGVKMAKRHQAISPKMA